MIYDERWMGFGAQNGSYGGHNKTCYVASQQACPCIEQVFLLYFLPISMFSSSRSARAYLSFVFAIDAWGRSSRLGRRGTPPGEGNLPQVKLRSD